MQDYVVPGVGVGIVVSLFSMCLVLFRLMLKTDRDDRAALRNQLVEQIKQNEDQRSAFQSRLDTQDKLHREECGRLQDQVTVISRHNSSCERRLNTLIIAANEAGMKIPPEVWSADA